MSWQILANCSFAPCILAFLDLLLITSTTPVRPNRAPVATSSLGGNGFGGGGGASSSESDSGSSGWVAGINPRFWTFPSESFTGSFSVRWGDASNATFFEARVRSYCSSTSTLELDAADSDPEAVESSSSSSETSFSEGET